MKDYDSDNDNELNLEEFTKVIQQFLVESKE